MICIKDDVNALSKKNEVAIEKLEDEVNGINGEFLKESSPFTLS